MIVIPMAGLSSRFSKVGYKKPKFMLEAKGKTLFAHSVISFEDFFKKELFVFIALDLPGIKKFIIAECQNLGLENYEIVLLKSSTRGQAETVYLGVKQLNVKPTEDMLIFNIDTFRPGYKWPQKFAMKNLDGYLETFEGGGANWSYVLPKNVLDQTVAATAEKKEISKYCCTGLYYWRRLSDFCQTYEKYLLSASEDLVGGEYYIAPMYNIMLAANKDIRYEVIDVKDVIFCGVPTEYEAFKNE